MNLVSPHEMEKRKKEFEKLWNELMSMVLKLHTKKLEEHEL